MEQFIPQSGLNYQNSGVSFCFLLGDVVSKDPPCTGHLWLCRSHLVVLAGASAIASLRSLWRGPSLVWRLGYLGRGFVVALGGFWLKPE